MSYQYSDMEQAEIEKFLQEPRIAIVGTNRVNGPPQLTPVWYLYQDDRIYLTMYVKSAKYRNLQRDPRIGICIPGENLDARAVMIYGTAEFVVESIDWTYDIRWLLMRRYHHSDEETQSYLDTLPTDTETTLAVVTPNKVIAQDFN